MINEPWSVSVSSCPTSFTFNFEDNQLNTKILLSAQAKMNIVFRTVSINVCEIKLLFWMGYRLADSFEALVFGSMFRVI